MISNNLKLIFITIFSFVYNMAVSQNQPLNVVWQEDVEEWYNTMIYKDKILTVNRSSKSIDIYDAGNLKKLASIALDKREIDGVKFDLFDYQNPQLLISKKGAGIIVKKEKGKERYFAFYSLNDGLDGFKEGKIIYQIKVGAGANYYENWSYKYNDTLISIRNDAFNINKSPSQQVFLSAEGVIYEKEYMSSNFYMHNNFICELSGKEETRKLLISDIKNGKTISKINIGEKIQDQITISSFKSLANGEVIITGYYGDFQYLNENQINGLFKFHIDKTGELISGKTIISPISQLDLKAEKRVSYKTLVTENGSVFFVLTSKVQGTIDHEKELYVIGEVDGKFWLEQIPFFQNVGTVQNFSHQGIRFLEKDNKLILIYNDDKRNQLEYDYDNYSYLKNKSPYAYSLSSSDACSFVVFNKQGFEKAYFIDLNSKKTNLDEALIIKNDNIIITTNRSSQKSKYKIAKVTLD